MAEFGASYYHVSFMHYYLIAKYTWYKRTMNVGFGIVLYRFERGWCDFSPWNFLPLPIFNLKFFHHYPLFITVDLGENTRYYEFGNWLSAGVGYDIQPNTFWTWMGYVVSGNGGGVAEKVEYLFKQHFLASLQFSYYPPTRSYNFKLGIGIELDAR